MFHFKITYYKLSSNVRVLLDGHRRNYQNVTSLCYPRR